MQPQALAEEQGIEVYQEYPDTDILLKIYIDTDTATTNTRYRYLA